MLNVSKKSTIVLCVSFMALFLFAAGALANAATGPVLFEDDFTGDLSKWTLDYTTDGRPDYFSISDGKMVFAPVAFGNALAGNPAWTDYSVEVELEVLEYGMFGNFRVFVRTNQIWNGYGISLFPDELTVNRFDGNWDQHETLADADSGSPAGKLTTLRVDVEGNEISVYVDGELVVQAVDENNVYSSGGIAIRADNVSAQIYRVTVRGK